jgi:hypothetical protein
MSDIKVTDLDRLALTKGELDALASIVHTGDRAGYDMAYYAMSGTSTVALEARIATFSGAVGGVAFGANRLLQQWFGPGSGATHQYPGIYFLSQRVAEHGLDLDVDMVEFDLIA